MILGQIVNNTYRYGIFGSHRLLGVEATHDLANLVLHSPAWRFFRPLNGLDITSKTHKLETSFCGLSLPSPVIGAAGMDKNCRFLGQLLDIGFGGVVGGTITLKERSGNEKPRLLVDRHNHSVVNAMGFPNCGVDKATKRLKRLKARKGRVFVSIAGDNEEEYARLYKLLAPHCSLIEINVSSPNTDILENFRNEDAVKRIFLALGKISTPVFLKLPRPDLPALEDSVQRRLPKDFLKMAYAAVSCGASGVVASNTLPIKDTRLARKKGGLSGRPLLSSTSKIVESLVKELDGAVVIASGGVFSASGVKTLLDCGAKAVQIYSSFVFSGPLLIRSLNKGLAKL